MPELKLVQLHSQFPAAHQLLLVVGERRRRRNLVTRKQQARPFDKLLYEGGSPFGPGSWPSGESISLRQREQQVQEICGAYGGGNGCHGGGVIEVTPRRSLGQQQMKAYEVDEDLDVSGIEAHPRSQVRDDRDAGLSVVARPTFA